MNTWNAEAFDRWLTTEPVYDINDLRYALAMIPPPDEEYKELQNEYFKCLGIRYASTRA